MQELGGQDESAESPNSPEGARNTARRMVDLADDLLTAAAVRYTRASRPVPTNREVVSKSVDDFLPLVIERLQRAGLTARPTGRRRPRNLDVATWQKLLDAEAEVSLSQIELLRCCLVLAARKGR
jgi:hypothetical protein